MDPKLLDSLVFVGTLHNMTEAEIEDLLCLVANLRPAILFVEIEPRMEVSRLSSYPSEMVAAYHWALKHGVAVRGFDSDIETRRAGVASDLESSITNLQIDYLSQGYD